MAKSYLLDGMFSVEGRARRSEWWLVGFGLSMLSGLLSMIVIAVFFGSDAFRPDLPPHQGAAIVRLAATLIILWPVIAVSVRRAHDRGKSGWLVYVYYGFNLLLAAYTAFAPQPLLTGDAAPVITPIDIAAFVLSCLQVGIGLWLLVTLGFLPGERKTNRYGQFQGPGQSNYRPMPVD